ncbi:unnamed protein product [Sphenostylis stenocarpa]|uniref:Uncharacterized protein n=1 Tax=Sphenostylis stenocarpa TaxID=92480 RepID=A0AA86T3B6_9FABA|nr:unnamed protein product [Sphenostylis stenocarpa]
MHAETTTLSVLFAVHAWQQSFPFSSATLFLQRLSQPLQIERRKHGRIKRRGSKAMIDCFGGA